MHVICIKPNVHSPVSIICIFFHFSISSFTSTTTTTSTVHCAIDCDSFNKLTGVALCLKHFLSVFVWVLQPDNCRKVLLHPNVYYTGVFKAITNQIIFTMNGCMCGVNEQLYTIGRGGELYIKCGLGE